MSKLVIIRHHESEWNKKGLWTGTRDAHLTPYGFEKSVEMGKLIQDITFDQAFASMQVRTIETLSCILDVTGQFGIPVEHIKALNERDYGVYTGKNKWDMEKLVGLEEHTKMRRDWNYPIPEGETLKDVYERVTPFYIEHIVPLLNEEKNILIVSHGNAIRALIKYIENIPEEEMIHVEMPFGGIYIYEVDGEGHKVTKEVRMIESSVVHA